MSYYYINASSEAIGPLEIGDLKNHGISPATLVWKNGLKEWTPAAELPELKVLFETETPASKITPPPVPGSVPPPLPSSTRVTFPAPGMKVPAAKFKSNRSRKIVVGVALLLVVISFGAFFFLRTAEPRHQVFIASDADTSMVDDDTTEDVDESKRDSLKVVDIDSLGGKLKWDTTAVVSDTNTQMKGDVSFLPGFGPQPEKSKKVKQGTTRKEKKRISPSDQSAEEIEERPQPRSNTTERISPLRQVSIKGSFRKNLFFEAVLEGTIYNKSAEQLRDVVVEVRFLDASGQPIGTKRFTHHEPLPPASSTPFRFKASAPKGARGAAFEIASAGK